MQISAKPSEVVTSKPVLVPPMLHRRYVPGEHQQKRRQRAELVDSHPLLQLHPLLDLRGVVAASPAVEVDDHNAGVEVAGLAVGECEGEGGVGPEGRGKIGSEVGVAVLWGGEDGGGAEGGGGELGNVVYQDEVGVEVDDASYAEGEEVGEVAAGVVEGAVEGGADGDGDEAGDVGVVEGVDSEFQVGEGGGDCVVEQGGVGVGGSNEVEDGVLGAG